MFDQSKEHFLEIIPYAFEKLLLKKKSQIIQKYFYVGKIAVTL